MMKVKDRDKVEHFTRRIEEIVKPMIGLKLDL
jgi:hypothetical protein